jgi:uncharacterized membrane protein YfcA
MEISLILGIVVGAVLGLTGAGGGILAAPALVAGMGWSMQQAAPVALIAVAGGAALGAVEGLRKGLVRYKAALVMVISGLPFVSIGAFTGFMTGLLGVGGGFVIVPMLRRFTNMSMHGIVATSLMVIALVGSGGVVAAVVHGIVLPLQTTALFALATAIGMLLGRQLAAHTVERHIQLGFSLVLIVVASGLFYKAIFN